MAPTESTCPNSSRRLASQPVNMAVLLLILIVLPLLYYYGTRNFNYWTKRNVKHEKPVPFFGNHHRNFFGKQSLSEIAVEMYNKYTTEKIVGYYRFSTPTLIIRDLELVKHILNTDFNDFHMRGLGRKPEVEPLMGMNLFSADGDRWKLMRKRLTPAFTTAKLKNMFPLVVSCAEKLQVMADQVVAKGGDVDAREMMARFTTEFIGACGFGIEMNSINNEHSLFREIGKKMFSVKLRTFAKVTLWEMFPLLRNYIYVLDRDIEVFMTDVVRNIVKQRNYKPCGRNDFIDLLLELKEKGTIKGESVEKFNPDGSPVEVEMEMDFKTMVAQVFIFFGAGFETSSSATSYLLHELAYNPDIQVKIQEEIDNVISKYNHKLCYDAISEMTLLDMAFKEALRLMPSLGVLNRDCARPYTIPGTDVTIDPGVRIIIPVQAIQTDEKYFENPTEFNPERFSQELEKTRNNYNYLPFGEGPRMCIGARLGQMQSLAGLAAVLQRYSVEPSRNSRLKLNPRSNVVQAVLGGLPLKLVPRNTASL